MKKICLLITGLLILSASVKSQSISANKLSDPKVRIKNAAQAFSHKSMHTGIENGTLETWSIDSFETVSGANMKFYHPDAWAPVNGFIYSFFLDIPVSISAVYDVAHANTSARIEIDTLNIGSDLATIFGVNQRVATLNGQYEFNGAPASAFFDIFASKYDPIGDTSVIVGVGTFETSSNTSGTFENFTANLQYMDETVVPDTFYVFASYLEGPLGTSLKFDNISVSYQTTGVSKELANKLTVYPNPSASVIYVNLSDGTKLENAEVSIFSMDGSLKIKHKKYSANDAIDMSSLPNGIYTLSVNDGRTIITQKISKI